MNQSKYKNNLGYYITSNISSTLRLFADDTKVYRELSNIARDSEALQLDVDQPLSWASKWQLRFNPDKCEVLRITHNRDLSLPLYQLGTSRTGYYGFFGFILE